MRSAPASYGNEAAPAVIVGGIAFFALSVMLALCLRKKKKNGGADDEEKLALAITADDISGRPISPVTTPGLEAPDAWGNSQKKNPLYRSSITSKSSMAGQEPEGFGAPVEKRSTKKGSSGGPSPNTKASNRQSSESGFGLVKNESYHKSKHGSVAADDDDESFGFGALGGDEAAAGPETSSAAPPQPTNTKADKKAAKKAAKEAKKADKAATKAAKKPAPSKATKDAADKAADPPAAAAGSKEGPRRDLSAAVEQRDQAAEDKAKERAAKLAAMKAKREARKNNVEAELIESLAWIDGLDENC